MTKRDEWAVITRDALAELYSSKTMTAIAAEYGVTPGAVAYRLRMWGLTARQTGKKHSPGPKARFNPPKEELEALYKTMSIRDIAAHYGVGETVIFTRIRDYGIPVIDRSDRLVGRQKSMEHRLNMSRALMGKMTGESNPNWKGGVSSENKVGRSRTAYHEWKAAVLAKAGYRCEVCGAEHGAICDHCGHRVLLHAHHIEPFAGRPELRYEPSNGKALCERCHQTEHYSQTG